jgi:hypothetical protein
MYQYVKSENYCMVLEICISVKQYIVLEIKGQNSWTYQIKCYPVSEKYFKYWIKYLEEFLVSVSSANFIK